MGGVYWGAGIALKAGERLYTSMQDTVPVTDRNQLIDRIFAYIRAKPREKLNIRDIYKGLWRHARSSKEIKEIVVDMIRADQLCQKSDGTLILVEPK